MRCHRIVYENSLMSSLYLYRVTSDQAKSKPKAAPKPKVVKVKVEEDDEGWTEVSAGARPLVSQGTIVFS